jgi:ABC-2 type transport system permease protein
VARVLVRLKLRLLVNAFGRSAQAAIGLAFASLGAVVGAAVAILIFLGGGRQVGVELWSDAVVLVLAALVIVWVIVPLLTFNSDETLDPGRVVLLPLRPRHLLPGLTLASLVGIAPTAAAVGMLGIVVGAGRAAGSPLGSVLAAIAVGSVLLVAVTWSRAAAAVLSNVLGSRRGAEVAAAIGGLLAVGAYGLWFAAQTSLADPEAEAVPAATDIDLSPVVAIARLTPGGLGGDAVALAAAGDPAGSLLRTGGVLVLAALGALAWGVALARVDRRSSPARSASTRTSAGLYPRLLAWLPRSRTTAVAVRFLRGLVRDPRVRTAALGQAILVLPIVFVPISGGALDTPRAPIIAAFLVVPLALVGTNGAALDGPALWQHEVAGADPSADLRGRTLALAILSAPLLVIGAVVVAALSEGWATVPYALALGVAVFLLTSGLAVATSVLLPIPVPERGANRFGSNLSGQGCVNSLGLAVVLVVLGILAVPILLAGLFVTAGWLRAVVGLVALGYGVGAFWLGLRTAVARLDDRGADLLMLVDPRAA